MFCSKFIAENAIKLYIPARGRDVLCRGSGVTKPKMFRVSVALSMVCKLCFIVP